MAPRNDDSVRSARRSNNMSADPVSSSEEVASQNPHTDSINVSSSQNIASQPQVPAASDRYTQQRLTEASTQPAPLRHKRQRENEAVMSREQRKAQILANLRRNERGSRSRQDPQSSENIQNRSSSSRNQSYERQLSPESSQHYNRSPPVDPNQPLSQRQLSVPRQTVRPTPQVPPPKRVAFNMPSSHKSPDSSIMMPPPQRLTGNEHSNMAAPRRIQESRAEVYESDSSEDFDPRSISKKSYGG